jgi:hypothetical protein
MRETLVPRKSMPGTVPSGTAAGPGNGVPAMGMPLPSRECEHWPRC